MNVSRQRSAVTLLELVVVTAILSVLLSLLLPALKHAAHQARRISCLNHLRQWGVATALYTIDHHDLLPRDGAPNGRSIRSGWYVDLPKQLGLEPYHLAAWRTNPVATLPKSPWICPSNPRRSNGFNLFHYCLNQHVNGSGVGNQVKLSTLPMPSQLIWMFDNGGLAAVAQQNNVHTNVHGQGANFLFLDGHATHRTSRDYWDFRRNRGLSHASNLKWHPFR